MIKIRDSIRIDASPEEVFALLAQPELLARHLDSIKELKVISRDDHALLTEVVVAANGRNSRLILETRLFPYERVEIHQIKGELRRLEFYDRLEAVPRGTWLTETVSFDLGLPLLGGLLGSLGIKQKMERQLGQRLAVLKRLAEQARGAAEGAAPECPDPAAGEAPLTEGGQGQ